MTTHHQPPRGRRTRRAAAPSPTAPSPTATASAPRTTGQRTTPARRPARREPSPLTGHLLEHRRAVAAWALRHGESLRLDTITAIIGAHAAAAAASGAQPHTWTIGGVDALLSRGAARWCLLHRMSPPPFLAESLCTYLEYLRAHELLHPDSDGVAELRTTAISNAALTRDGRRRMNAGEAASRNAHPTFPGRRSGLTPAT